MASDIRPASEKPRALAAFSDGPTIATAYIVSGGVGGRWKVDTTGPAEAYAVLDDTRYVVDDGASEHQAFFRAIEGRVVVR